MATRRNTASGFSISSGADRGVTSRGGDRPSIAARAEAWLTRAFAGLAALAAIAGGAIVVLIGVSVTRRYFANAPLRVTEELVGLLMTAAFFLALPLVTLKAEHVRVTVVVAGLPAAARRWVGAAAGLFGVAFCLWYFVLAMPWLAFAFERGLKTEAARLLMYPWMAVIPVSLILTAVAFAIRGITAR